MSGIVGIAQLSETHFLELGDKAEGKMPRTDTARAARNSEHFHRCS